MDATAEQILERLVQVGIVSSVDLDKRKVRVIFEDTGITSGWLLVLQHYATGIYVEPDGKHTHTISDTFTGGGNASSEPEHKHPNTHLTYWMPKVNDQVLVLYLPVFNADGFILGGV